MPVCIVHGGDLGVPSGGTDRITAFAAGLADHGWEVTVVCHRCSGRPPSELDGITIRPVQEAGVGRVSQPQRSVRVVRQARSIVDETDATLQFVHATLGGVAALFGHSGYLLDMHDFGFASPVYGDRPFGTLLQRLVKRVEARAVREAGHILVVSEVMRDFLVEHWDIDPATVSIVPNGYWLSRVEPYRDTNPVEGRVVFLGTLHPKVDYDAIVATAQAEHVDEVIVIGDGPRRATLEERLRTEAVSNVDLLGHVRLNSALAEVASAAVAINPQRRSRTQTASSPVKLYTYAGLGVPIVSTSGPEFAAKLADAGAAELVRPGASFAAAVDDVLADPARRRKMADHAIEASVGERWADRIDDVIAAHRTLGQ